MCMNGKGLEIKQTVGHSNSSCKWKDVLCPSILPQTEEIMLFSLETFS